MFRRVTAAALVVFVQLGVVSAPLMHVHLDADETDHHHGQTLHSHLSGHHAPPGTSTSGAKVDHDESGRTIAPEMFVAVAADPADTPALPRPAFVLLVPAVIAAGRAPQVAHGHDPPFLISLPSRAPPAFLS